MGRRKLIRAKSDADIAAAGALFAEGLRRGVPFYSLSVEWLARGLESLPGYNEELRWMRQVARSLAAKVDPGHAFTVIRVRG